MPHSSPESCVWCVLSDLLLPRNLLLGLVYLRVELHSGIVRLPVVVPDLADLVNDLGGRISSLWGAVVRLVESG